MVVIKLVPVPEVSVAIHSDVVVEYPWPSAIVRDVFYRDMVIEHIDNSKARLLFFED